MSADSKDEGFVTVRWLEHRVLELVFAGRIDATLVEHLRGGVAAHLAESSAVASRPSLALIDASQVTDYSIDVAGPGRLLLAELRAGGCAEAVCAVGLPHVRAMGSALALAASLPIRFVETREAALSLLEQRKAGPDSGRFKRPPRRT